MHTLVLIKLLVHTFDYTFQAYIDVHGFLAKNKLFDSVLTDNALSNSEPVSVSKSKC